MTQQNNLPQTVDHIIEDALQTLPIADAPETLLQSVMSRVQATAPVPAFRLTWFDYAISLFGAGMAGIIFMLWQTLPIFTVITATLEQLSHPGLFYLSATILGGTILVITAVLAALILFPLQSLSFPTKLFRV